MFFNYETYAYEADAVRVQGSRYFIRKGFAGFNSPANNRLGYASQAGAEAAIRRYQMPADRIAELVALRNKGN